MYTLSEAVKFQPFTFIFFSEFLNTDAFFRKPNLTSRHKMLTGKRQYDDLSFKEPFVAEEKLGPDL